MASPTEPPVLSLSAAAEAALALGADATSQQIATTTVEACTDLSAHLGRLLGLHGTAAVFARSLALTRRRHPWIAEAGAEGRAEPPWPALAAALAAQDAETARAGALALVTRFLELLGRLIGSPIVLHLLGELWPERLPTPSEENP